MARLLTMLMIGMIMNLVMNIAMMMLIMMIIAARYRRIVLTAGRFCKEFSEHDCRLKQSIQSTVCLHA